MDISALFALKGLAAVVGYAVGLVIGSLLGAIWLRLAALWLGFGDIPYREAFKHATLSNFAVTVIHFSISFNYGFTVQMLSGGSSPVRSLTFAFSPIYFLYVVMFSMVITAAIFRRVVTNAGDSSRVSFGDSFALAALYYSLSFAFLVVLVLLVVLLIAGIMSLIV